MKYVGNISVQKEDIQYVMNAVTNDNSYGGTGDMSGSRRVTSCSIYQDINLSPVPMSPVPTQYRCEKPQFDSAVMSRFLMDVVMRYE